MKSSAEIALDIGVGNNFSARAWPQPQYIFENYLKNTGSLEIKIPQSLPTSNKYRFRLQPLDLSALDVSDGDFFVSNSDNCLANYPAITIRPEFSQLPSPTGIIRYYKLGTKNVEIGSFSLAPSANCGSLIFKQISFIVQGYFPGYSVINNLKLVDQNGSIFATLSSASGSYLNELFFENTQNYTLKAQGKTTFTLYGDLTTNPDSIGKQISVEYNNNNSLIKKDNISLNMHANASFVSVNGDIEGPTSFAIGRYINFTDISDTTFPVGCTSNLGYSSITGLSCSGN
jgi:hypothetical protein